MTKHGTPPLNVAPGRLIQQGPGLDVECCTGRSSEGAGCVPPKKGNCLRYILFVTASKDGTVVVYRCYRPAFPMLSSQSVAF